MHPVLILLIGVVIVVGGVLVLRLHAFLALTLAALVVGALTPSAAVERYWIEKNRVKNVSIDAESGQVVIGKAAKNGIQQGMLLLLMQADSPTSAMQEVARLRVDRLEEVSDGEGKKTTRAITMLAGGRLPQASDGGQSPKFTVVSPVVAKRAADDAKKTVGERVAAAFGNTCANIGILIAMAAIIGKCLLDSGAADRVVRSSMRVTGERGAPAAFVGSGFLLGIPVFFDTVFYLMIPLGKALRMRTGRNYLLYILSIVAGATMAHSLVPPTPGPLFVAEQLGVDIGLMIVAGAIVGLFSSTAAYFYASFVNRYSEVPLRESADFSLDDLEELSKRDESQLPPLLLALMPIVLPVVLIAGFTVIKTFKLVATDSDLYAISATLGNKNIALALATAIAMGMLVWQKRTSLKDLGAACSSALASGGVIILITAGGGAFGGMLQQTGVAGLISTLPDFSYLVVLALAWLITTGIRTAQGSATVAMITAVGVLAGFADGGLGCHPVYLALAIGCGSKPVAWMNDSGFWVICKMSGMTEAEGLRYVTPMSVLMGLVGLVVTLAAAAIFPMPLN